MPVFTADPAWCEINYQYTISDTYADKALTFDAATRTFTFEALDDLVLSGNIDKDYTVTVTGVTGNVTPT